MDSRDQNDNATRVPFYLNLFSASGGAGRRALLNDTDDLGTSCASFSFLRRTHHGEHDVIARVLKAKILGNLLSPSKCRATPSHSAQSIGEGARIFY